MKLKLNLSTIKLIIKAVQQVEKTVRGKGTTKKKKAMAIIKTGLGVAGALAPEKVKRIGDFIDTVVETGNELGE